MAKNDTTAEVSDLSLGKASLIFWTIAVLYGIVWTLFPYFLERNFRYDTIEMFLIGREGVVSTPKHPALNSAILEITWHLLGRNAIAPYLLSQLFFLLTAWSVWRLGREFLSPRWALFGALAFYGYWGYFYQSFHYNHNVLLFPMWGFVTLFGFLALKYGRLRDWIVLGVAIGIGVHCKYTILVLVAAILLFMAVNPRARRYWRGIGPYLTFVVSFTLALPQFVWLIQSDFSCLKYPAMVYGLEKTFPNRLYSVFFSGITSVPVLLSSFALLFCPILGFRWRLRTLDDDHRFARNYLIFAVFAPWLIQLASAFSACIPMNYINYMQLFIFTGPLCLLAHQAKQERTSIRMFWVIFVCIMGGLGIGYWGHDYHTIRTHREASYVFSGRELAEKAEKIWHEHYDTPLPFTTGGWWYGGNVAIYGKDRPRVHCSSNPRSLEPGFMLSNWSTDRDVWRSGGLVFWGLKKNDPDKMAPNELPDWLRQRFPSAKPLPPIVLDPVGPGYSPVSVGIAIVPPDPTITTEPVKLAPWHYYRER